jgi:bifunctional DNase/RNase
MDGYEKMSVYGVSFDVASKQPIVLLKSENTNRFLPIWIGHPEAAAILMRLQETELPRPMTHDLFTNVLGFLSTSLQHVLVTELRDNTFYAVLHLLSGEREMDVDSRPSDAIALAVRTEAPIFAANELLDTNGVELDQEETEDVEGVVTEFKQFLDAISPEDF